MQPRLLLRKKVPLKKVPRKKVLLKKVPLKKVLLKKAPLKNTAVIKNGVQPMTVPMPNLNGRSTLPT